MGPITDICVIKERSHLNRRVFLGRSCCLHPEAYSEKNSSEGSGPPRHQATSDFHTFGAINFIPSSL